MTALAALLRGVNVGGKQSLPMADLRRLLTDLGYGDVQTYLQSGNAVFTTDRTDTDKIAREIEDGVAALGVADPGCLILQPDRLRRVVDANPLADQAAEPAKLQVVFLSDPPLPEKVAAIDRAAYLPDVFEAGEREVYVYYPEGIRRTKLTHAFFQKKLEVAVATARNWNTVTALLERVS